MATIRLINEIDFCQYDIQYSLYASSAFFLNATALFHPEELVD